MILFSGHPVVIHKQKWRSGSNNHNSICNILLYIILQYVSAFIKSPHQENIKHLQKWVQLCDLILIRK
jgi:hypothetical protein